MNKLESIIPLPGLTPLRAIGVSVITVTMLMLGATLNIIESAILVLGAMGQAFSSSWSNEAQFGRTCFIFYALLTMVAFVAAVWSQSKARVFKKILFSVMMFIVIGIIFVQSVLGRVIGNYSNWYYDFWFDTLSPVGLVAGYCLMVRLFWAMTKPEADDTPEATASAV